jgi:Ca2+-binding RTX toxin-like protein
MATHTLSSDRTTQWAINKDNDTWTLAENAQIHVKDVPAVFIDSGFDNNTINIKGDILNFNGQAGVHCKADNTTINFGAESKVKGIVGAYIEGQNTTIDNKADIRATAYGIYTQETTHIENSGNVDSPYGVVLVAAPPPAPGNGAKSAANAGEFLAVVENHKNGEIFSEMVGVLFNGQGKQTLVNDGYIFGGVASFSVVSGTGYLVNHGRMDGLVRLSDGNDFVDTRGGRINGELQGRGGNDIYVVSKTAVDIVEGVNGGKDTVRSDADHKLAANIENLALIGKGDADGWGNGLANRLTGNAGDNRLLGGAGDDQISGGKGTDVLTGGAGSDVFIFHKGDGVDTIRDFDNSADTISLMGLSGAGDFSKVSQHMTTHGDDVWITYGSDRLVLHDTKLSDMDMGDFNFPV